MDKLDGFQTFSQSLEGSLTKLKSLMDSGSIQSQSSKQEILNLSSDFLEMKTELKILTEYLTEIKSNSENLDLKFQETWKEKLDFEQLKGVNRNLESEVEQLKL